MRQNYFLLASPSYSSASVCCRRLTLAFPYGNVLISSVMSWSLFSQCRLLQLNLLLQYFTVHLLALELEQWRTEEKSASEKFQVEL